jgi:hypothetical protein
MIKFRKERGAEKESIGDRRIIVDSGGDEDVGARQHWIGNEPYLSS